MAAAPAAAPGPRGFPVLGSLPHFRRDSLRYLSRLAREYGDVVRFFMGPQETYLLNHPDLVRDVLITRNDQFMKGRVLQRAKALLGEGLLTSEGEHHLRQRRLMQPAFHRQRLAGYGAMMVDAAARWRERPRDGEVRDMAEEMMRLTLAIVGLTLFSRDVEGEAAEVGAALHDVLSLFPRLMLPWSQWRWFPGSGRFEGAKARLDAIVHGMIRERRASGDDKGDLLSMLLMAQDEQGTGGMSDEQVRDEALTIFLAGHETTANALMWTWYLLAQNPEAEASFHREVDSVLAGRLPSVDDLPRLVYTEQVLAESMRLYPPAWVIGRMALHDVPVGEYLIPARSVLLLSPYVLQRDARFFPDPERFQPERWTPEARESRPKFAYFPFGGGPRLCIGERFAWMEGTLLLAVIAQRWRFRLVSGHPVVPRPLMTMRARYGMRMTVHARP